MTLHKESYQRGYDARALEISHLITKKIEEIRYMGMDEYLNCTPASALLWLQNELTQGLISTGEHNLDVPSSMRESKP